MRMSATLTTCPARILAVLRNSFLPSTFTTPLSTMTLPAPPLSHKPTSLSSWFSSMNSELKSKLTFCIVSLIAIICFWHWMTTSTKFLTPSLHQAVRDAGGVSAFVGARHLQWHDPCCKLFLGHEAQAQCRCF